MDKKTATEIARKASEVLLNNNTSKKSKSVAGSVLSQAAKEVRKTSPEVATKASQILQDGRTSKVSKSVAGSALSQKQTNKPKKK